MCGCKKKETFTITFDANGGTGTMEAQTFTEGEAQALSRNAFTYDGYTFSGWNTVQGGSGASYSDGQTIIATADMTLFAQWEKITRGQSNGHDWVDLGLPSGTKWATCNVGADTPEGYGDYFAWGETATKEIYNWSTYRYYDGSTLTKYTSSDNLTVLEASDDAASANSGTGWRMPTREDMNELFNNCTHEWTIQNGVNGRKFTGNNGNSIFIPAAGYRSFDIFNNVGLAGIYWSSSRADDNGCAWLLDFASDYHGINWEGYFSGFSVRPVYVN